MTEQFLNVISVQQIFTFSCLAIIGSIGAFCKFIVQNYDFGKSPYEIEKPQVKSWDVVSAYIIARLVLGSVAGVLVGLILIDALKPETGPFLRLMFFGWLAGYSAPELMKSQEKVMLEILKRQMEKVAKENDSSEY